MKGSGSYTIELHFGSPTGSKQDVFTNQYPDEASARRFAASLKPGPGAPVRCRIWHRGELLASFCPGREVIALRPPAQPTIHNTTFGTKMEGEKYPVSKGQSPNYISKAKTPEELGL